MPPDDLVAALPRLDPARVLVVGARDQRELAEAGVPSIDGIVEIVRDHAGASTDPPVAGTGMGSRLSRNGPWWLHVDLDILSTESLGAVDFRQPGGIAWDALTRLTRGALANPGLLGWDVTIYNPDLDPFGADAKRIVRYVAEAIGV